ncbi:hypothetical protein Lalb_Chr19g0132261 [Lupinus albus]|uniref:Uncharacterized protein n=1 Tax=Lupinus albus TaxID=3870 RepID=A0A6A4NXY0_LUPAL|nr:hypothetical protein Lalb_Chr19g0132261 [Lupinus albus]
MFLFIMNTYILGWKSFYFYAECISSGEGISLIGASHIIIFDVRRPFILARLKKESVYRLIAVDSPEEEDHNTW